ncbi:MAG: hypothetical protein IJP13_07710 [Lachnospiraceae bacterium]|nr:hypothetical protein [Lachnospiraceae bacterium]
MADVCVLDSLYHIVDGSGNYYRVNSNEQLVVATNRNEAGIFNFVEANQRIGGGRKAHFYSVISIDEYEEKECVYVEENITTFPTKAMTVAEEEDYYVVSEQVASEKNNKVSKSSMDLPYDLRKIDWLEYMTHFAYVASATKDYHQELNEQLSKVDMEICDIMHLIELYDLGIDEMTDVMGKLKQCREYRRDIKDEMHNIENFKKYLGTTDNIAKAKSGVKQIEKLQYRKYTPRMLDELFSDDLNETKRNNRLWDECDESNQDAFMKEETKEEAYMNIGQRKETLYDNKKNDWISFAVEQAEFYANAGQYMCNLKLDINELDEKIESVLENIENASCNAAQGYKVFKELKDLRSTRKTKEEELSLLIAITKNIDCMSMAEKLVAVIKGSNNVAV